MDANLLIWVGQVVLALAFLAVGYGHAFSFDATRVRPRMDWVSAVGRSNMRVIGLFEVIGAIGLIVPAATGILPWLTPVAATLLAILMVLAAIFHLRRQGEASNAFFNLVLAVLAALVAYGRFVVAPF